MRLIIINFITFNLFIFPSFAIQPDTWKDNLYSFRGTGASVSEVLTSFASSYGLNLRLSQDNRYTAIPAQLPSIGMRPDVFLNTLGNSHRLQWFVYGGQLYVSSTSSAVTSRIETASLAPSVARQALLGLGLFESKFGWGELDLSNTVVLVFGPASYIALIRQAIGKVITISDDAIQPVPMLFKLKHALAIDVESNTRGKLASIPGVATVLQNILGPSNSSLSEGIENLNFKSPGPISQSRQANLESRIVSSQDQLPSTRTERKPIVQAYAPLNAVIVRDLPKNKHIYEALIAELDIPRKQVEILVTMVDVDADELREWSAGVSVGGSKFVASSSPAYPVTTVSPVAAGSVPALLWASKELSLRLRALQSEGRAKILLRPSILTLEHEEAVLDMSQSAHLRLIGERTVDMRTVTVGTLLKVTPHIIEESSGQSVQIQVQIEDGSLQNAGNQGDSVVTRQNTISTHALVKAGQTLVIGGHRQETTQRNNGKVPILSELPWIGGLFRADSSGSTTRERLFMLSARVIDSQNIIQLISNDSSPITVQPIK